MAQETEIEFPDGRKVIIEHDGELTDEAIKNVASQMGYDAPSSRGDLLANILGEGTRIGGAITGAIKGSRRGPLGSAIGGLIGAAVAEPVARKITPREESTGESVANIALAAIQPASRAAPLLTRLGRGALTGAGLGAGHAAIETGIEERRLPTFEELAPSAGIGALVGSGLEGLIGARPRPVAGVAKEAPTKELPITASLDKPRPTSLEQANSEANTIAQPSKAKQAAPAQPEQPLTAAIDDEEAIEAAAEAQAKARRVSIDDEAAIEAEAAAQAAGKKSAEKIESAAVKFADGEIRTGKTHAQIVSEIDENDLRGSEDGFVTSTGRYVSREEAMEIAKKSAQVEEGLARKGLVVEALNEKPLPPETIITHQKLGGKSFTQVDIPDPKGGRPLFSGSLADALNEGYKFSLPRELPEGKTTFGKLSEIKAKEVKEMNEAGQAAVKADRAEYDKLQAQMKEMGFSKVGTPEFNDIWAKSEAIKNRHGGMPPGETAGGPPLAQKPPLNQEKALKEGVAAIEAQKAVKAKEKASTPPPPESPSIPIVNYGDEPDFKVRGHAKRAIESEFIPVEVREAIKKDPNIIYERHKQGEWVNRAEAATDDEIGQLIESASSLDESIIYKKELINRLTAKGQFDEAAKIWVGQAQSLTPVGQAMSAARMVRTAFGELVEAEEIAAKVGRNLTEEQKQRVLEIASRDIQAQKNLNNAARTAKEFYNKENLEAYRKAQIEYGKTKKELDEYLDAIKPRDFADMAVKMIQGNLLTPISITSNVAGNIIFGPLQRASMSAASMIDVLVTGSGKAIAKLTGRDPSTVERSIQATNPLPSLRELKAALNGLKTASGEILTGPSAESYVKAEVQSGFRPYRSALDFIHGTNLPLDESGNIARWDRAKALMEATLGIAPETMFRMLALGDKPFRRAAEMRALLEQAKLRGVKDENLEKFINFPDARTKAIVEAAGRRAVFAEENRGITTLNRFLDSDVAKLLRVDKIPILAGAAKIFGRLTVPFRQFPVNYALTAMNFAAPPLAMSKAAYYAFKAKQVLSDESLSAATRASQSLEYRRKSLINLGEAAMGAMMYSAAEILWRHGLISESPADTSAKRSDQAERMGAAKLNVSGLERLMNGEDPSYKKGDRLREWTRLGIPAVIFHIYSDQAVREQEKAGKLGEKSPDIDYSPLNVKNLAGAAPGIGSFIFDQSFLTGTSSLLEAIKDADPESPKFQNWVQNMFRASTAIAIPNTVEAVARTKFDYIPELRGNDLSETLGNIWSFKLMKLDKDDANMVFKRDTWGRKLPRTPEGANKYVYHLMDVSKAGSQKADPYDQALFDLFESTNKDTVYPDPLTRTFAMPDGSTVELTPEYYERLQETVGGLRREAMERFVDSAIYARLEPMERVMALEKLYENANRQGRQQFLTRSGLMQDQMQETPQNKPVSRTTKGSLIEESGR